VVVEVAAYITSPLTAISRTSEPGKSLYPAVPGICSGVHASGAAEAGTAATIILASIAIVTTMPNILEILFIDLIFLLIRIWYVSIYKMRVRILILP
jgi:hypothetical protein